MPNQNNYNYLLDELVTFIQHHLPGLGAGSYQLSVAQMLFDKTNRPVNDDNLQNSYTFAVKGDRFRFSNPSQTIAAVFPAENSSGEYTTVLPHVLFYKKTLPWIRYPTLAPPYAPVPPGGDTDADVPTWLAVLLLDEDDVANFPQLQLKPQNLTIGDLLPPAAYALSTLGDNVSYFDGARDTADLQYGEQLSDAIQAIDLPLPLFWQIAPALNDLNFLAHARQVSLVHAPTNPNAAPPGEPTGDFSLVFGNRLPQTKKKATAYLVSLEALEKYLPTEEGDPPTGLPPKDLRSIRLAVLHNWTFFSTGENATFTEQVQALNGGSAGTNANLRLIPNAGSNPVVQNALNMGYVPLNHQLRTGGQTVSWYRGPLVPYQIPTTRVTLPIASPDAATVFDPTTGMLDVSYAAAWTIGRMLALQDSAFSTALYNWKKTVQAVTVAKVENELIAEKFDSVLQMAALSPTGEATEMTPARSLQHQLLHTLLQTK